MPGHSGKSIPYPEDGDGSTKLERFSSSEAKTGQKVSHAMPPAFMVSAPGKVIVFGEHSVVHGKAAIAAAISLRSYLHVSTQSGSKRTVSLRFPDIDFVHSWNMDDLPWSDFQQPSKKSYDCRVTELDQDLVAALQPHVEVISPDEPEEPRRVHRSSAFAFLYLFLTLASPSFPGCLYTLRSTIPIGAGLGSSASVSVCLATALLLQFCALSLPHPDQPADEAINQLERINSWAFVSELCIHGNPSGVDNTVATQGKAVVFQRTASVALLSVRPLWNFPELPLLLADTRQMKSTAQEVAKVAKRKETLPTLMASIFDAMHEVTSLATNLITNKDISNDYEQTLADIGELMSVNHGLLVALGVSHPRLERIRELVDHEGIGWTKLTGAGGGGCSITLLRPGVTRAKLQKLERQLADENYGRFEVSLGSNGVGVLWPTTLGDDLEETRSESPEISLDSFLSAEGSEGVDKLVGMRSDIAERDGWKFWRIDAK